jgi:glucose-1-phosphate adenylyltransferase
VNKDGVREANREEQGYLIKDGIVVIVKNAHILDGTVI